MKFVILETDFSTVIRESMPLNSANEVLNIVHKNSKSAIRRDFAR